MSGTWHFYVDDYRFTNLIKRPDKIVNTQCNSAIEPNFSIFNQMPIPVGLFRIYQKRWIARYWQQHGIRVIVDLNVAPKFRAYNLLGVPIGWGAYATRGYTDRLDQLEAEYNLAKTHASGNPLLFIVYGGGKLVKQYCAERAWLWFDEYSNTRRESNGKN